jgi:hypothetical protein
MPAPVIIFCYNRPDCLKSTIEHLARNHSSSSTQLYVFSDGAATSADEPNVNMVRNYLKSVSGFEEVTVVEASCNIGLAKSIIDGVSMVLQKHSKVIVLEDDLLTSENFLNFMNESLDFYEQNDRVFSISGYTVPITFPDYWVYDNYFTHRASSWGWATWRNRWSPIDWEVADYKNFASNVSARKKFNLMGSDLSQMLDRQMSGKINSWAIRWCYHQFKCNTYTVFPCISKVENIGFTSAATHTKPVQFSRFATAIDMGGKREFKLNPFANLDNAVIMQFTKTFSIGTRMKFKLLGMIPSVAVRLFRSQLTLSRR